jgi:hypothetical protein
VYFQVEEESTSMVDVQAMLGLPGGSFVVECSHVKMRTLLLEVCGE